MATQDAVYPFARDHLHFPEQITQEGLEPHKVRELWFWGPDDAEIIVDVTAGIEAATCSFEGRTIPVTTSAGVASLTCCGPTRDRATLLATADRRLYQAKQSGRNRVVGP